jgi:hypothetical protein
LKKLVCCNCVAARDKAHKKKTGKRLPKDQRHNWHGTWSEVPTDKNGKCIYCGFYTYAHWVSDEEFKEIKEQKQKITIRHQDIMGDTSASEEQIAYVINLSGWNGRGLTIGEKE